MQHTFLTYSMNNILDLPGHPIWEYFIEILQIPRASGKEEKILAYLKDFAQNHNLAYLQDKPGNLLIKKEATEGKDALTHLKKVKKMASNAGPKNSVKGLTESSKKRTNFRSR